MKKKDDIITAEQIEFLFAGIAKSIASSLDSSKIITAIMKQVDLFFHADNWSLLRLDPNTHELFFAIAKGIDIKTLKSVRLKLGEGIAGHAAKTGKMVFVPDVECDSRFSTKIDNLSGFKTRSVIAAPMIYHHQVLGIIELINKNERQFTRYEASILETIADFSALALTNATLYEHVALMAVSDALTGLYNRERLDRLLKIPKKRKTDHSFVIAAWIDLNAFKLVNDQFGHHVGDEILRKTANLIKNCCRQNDFAFRVGGDEFLLVIMNLKKNDISATQDRLISQLETYSKQISPCPGFSYGIASGKNINLKDIIIEADNLMYENKRHGKIKAYD